MNLKLHLIASVFLGSILTVNAQNALVRNRIALTSNTDRVQLAKFVEKNNQVYNLEKLKSRAIELGAPLTFTDARGNIAHAVGVNSLGDIIYLANFNSGMRLISNVNDIASEGELGLNLDGMNMQVGVWDGDVGLNSHFEFIDGNSSRLQMMDIPITDSSMTQNTIESRQHATHVAGTVGASGIDSKAKGMAPNAKIISYNWNNDANKMIKEAGQGMLVSNHSYGTPGLDNYGNQTVPDSYFGAYEDRAIEIDNITYSNKYYLPVQAAGNDGWQFGLKPNKTKDGNELILTSATAKNNVVVAAAATTAPYSGPNSFVLAPFNSNGPTNDFRIKPDITAKGVDVYSSSFKDKTTNNFYQSMNGTSMAAPAVTGIIALWQQWAIEYNDMAFLSATIKAIMVNSAMEAGDNVGPDHKFGWGFIDARKGVELMIDAKAKRNTKIQELSLREGEIKKIMFTVGENGAMFKTTIAWTDPAGSWSYNNFNEAYVKENPNLVNDLDLRVFRNGEEFFPWKLNKDFKNLIALKEDNNVDNVEQVEIELPEEGEYEIVISHKKTLKGGKQDFSLVATTDAEFKEPEIITPEVKSDSFKFYPNPVVNNMKVLTPQTAQSSTTEVTIFDINGRLVGTYTINAVDFEAGNDVNVSGLSSGVYFVEFKNGSIKTMDKMVKK